MNGNCFICGKWDDLDTHHIYGNSNRKKSELYGHTIRICRACHDDLHFRNPENYAYLKQDFQRIHEQTYSREHFMREFGKNYLDD
jgi:predicted metal-binding protein